jgi:chlorite dismutase
VDRHAQPSGDRPAARHAEAATAPGRESPAPARESTAPATLEGWFVLHDVVAVDWPRWNGEPASAREAIAAEAVALLERQEEPGDGHSACFSLLTQKGDLCFLHYRRDLETLRAAELALRRTRLYGYLVPTYSYLSVVELGTYELRPLAARALAKRGVDPARPDYDQLLHQEMMTFGHDRLFLAVPPGRYVCFYPMSKRRGEHVNWYALGGEERAAYMRGHGLIGRKYAGRVVQVISGSVGLDDWEWGVTLFADDPLVFKKLVYEMRFDPASAHFGLFGPFYVGIRLRPADLPAVLSGERTA